MTGNSPFLARLDRIDGNCDHDHRSGNNASRRIDSDCRKSRKNLWKALNDLPDWAWLVCSSAGLSVKYIRLNIFCAISKDFQPTVEIHKVLGQEKQKEVVDTVEKVDRKLVRIKQRTIKQLDTTLN